MFWKPFQYFSNMATCSENVKQLHRTTFLVNFHLLSLSWVEVRGLRFQTNPFEFNGGHNPSNFETRHSLGQQSACVQIINYFSWRCSQKQHHNRRYDVQCSVLYYLVTHFWRKRDSLSYSRNSYSVHYHMGWEGDSYEEKCTMPGFLIFWMVLVVGMTP